MRRLVLLAVLLAAAAAEAQVPRAADLVTWRVRAERAAPGAEARLVVDATIAPGWRLYAADSPVGIPFRLSLDGLPAGVTAGALRQQAPRTAYDEAFATDYSYFAESARFVQPLAVGARAARGEHAVTGALRFAVCDDRICLPPTQQAFRVPLVVE